MGKRQSNIELLRIVAMLMIIGFHLAANGVLLCYDSSPDRLQIYNEGSFTNKVFTGLLMPGGHIGVGIFFAITGYFLVMASKINYKKTFITVRFYGLLLSIVALICLMCGYSFHGLSILGVLSSVFLCLTVPAFGNIWWFVTAYVILLFLAPAINNMMKPGWGNMVDNQEASRRWGGVILLLSWILGYGISWFPGTGICNIWRAVFFYMMGAYIRLYQPKINFLKYKHVRCLTLVVLWMLSSFFISYGYTNALNSDSKVYLFSHISLAFNEVFIVPLLVYIILKEFIQMSIPYNEKINKMASTVFGIYIIHECPFMRPVIWQSLLGMSNVQFHSIWYPFTALLSIAGVFLVGMLVDLLRQKYAEGLMLNWTDRVISKFQSNK